MPEDPRLEVKYPFYSRKYKLCKYFHKYFKKKYIYDAISAFLALLLAIFALVNKQQPALIIGITVTYFFIQVLRAYSSLVKTGRGEQYYKEIIRQYFHYMNKRLFGETPCDHRFTLFTIDTVNANYIIPYARYCKGGGDAGDDAEKSKARYPKGYGYTGIAWDKPGQCWYRKFDEFKTREQFNEFYEYELNIPAEIVKDLSPRMMETRHIFCWGIADATGKFLGVLSLDSRVDWPKDPPEMKDLAMLLGCLEAILVAIFTVKDEGEDKK